MKHRLILLALLFAPQATAASDPPVSATAQIWETPQSIPSDHSILGTWVYTHNGSTYQREFTPEGKCTLIRDRGSASWSYPYKVVDARTVEVYSEKTGNWLRHELRSDGRLDVEGRYLATRLAPRPDGRPPRPAPPSRPKPLAATDLDLRVAFLAAQMSSRAYDHHPDFSNVPEAIHWVLRGEVQRRDLFELREQIKSQETDTEVLIAGNSNGMLFVAFRGTEGGAEGTTDRNTSLKMRKVEHREGCMLHKGYFDAYKSIEGRLDDRLHLELARLQRDCDARTTDGRVVPCGTVVFTGHSLGGALATIAYQRFAEKQQRGVFPNWRVIDPELYSFGAQRAMTYLCQRQIWTDLGLKAHAILNYDDRLSGFVPSRGRGEDRYVYPDKVYLFDEDRKLKVVSGATHHPDRGASGGHKLEEYRKSLNRAFKKAGWPLEKRLELVDASSVRNLLLVAKRPRVPSGGQFP